MLFEIYKKLTFLISISEHWLCSDQNTSEESVGFINSLSEVTNYFFDDYALFSKQNINFRKHSKININRQLLIHNIGVHIIIF